MHIELSLSKEDGVLPPVFHVLRADAERAFGLALPSDIHPAARYSRSLQAIARRILTLINLLQDQSDAVHGGEHVVNRNSEVSESIDHVLDTLMEHIDCCKEIAAFYSRQNPNAKAIHVFKKAIEGYRNEIGRVDNRLKHNGGQVRLVSMSSGDNVVLGYFVEGAVEGGLGPDPHVHTGGNTAFSIFRNLSLHICGVYSVSMALLTAIYLADRGVVKSTSQVAPGSLEGEWLKVLSGVISFGPYVFPDESKQPFPLIRLKDECLQVAFPSPRIRGRCIPLPANVRYLFGGDGVTRKFKMPYFQGK